MKLMILETVLETVMNDETLKVSQKEWLLYFSNWLNWVNTNKYNDIEYCNISALYLKKIFGKEYNTLINYFQEKGWLDIITSSNGNKSYTVGSESTKYIITLPLDCNLTPYNFTAKTVINKLEKMKSGELKKEFKENKNKPLNEEDIEDQFDIYFKLVDIIKTYRDEIEIEKRYRTVLDKVTATIPNSLLEDIEDVKDRLETLKSKKQFNYIKKEIKKINKELTTLLQEKHKLQDFNEENEYKAFTIDSFGNRAHTSFTRLKRKYRASTKLNNKEMIEIDITNAQPWLLSNLPGITDTNFINDCKSGCFYEKFLTTNNKEERNQVKVFIYQLFFGTYQMCRAIYLKDLSDKNSILNKFITLYPTVWEFIEKYNDFNHKNLSYTLQNMESDLMVFTTWNELFENEIDAITLHDGIFVNPENYTTALEILKKNILNKKYTMPTFKTK